MKLPPDPEHRNDLRALQAATTLADFREVTGTEPEDAICDLIAKLAHHGDRAGLNLSNEIRLALMHYDEETNGKGRQFHGISLDLPAYEPQP